MRIRNLADVSMTRGKTERNCPTVKTICLTILYYCAQICLGNFDEA